MNSLNSTQTTRILYHGNENNNGLYVKEKVSRQTKQSVENLGIYLTIKVVLD